MGKLWNDLFLDNPVVRDSQRAFLQYLRPRGWPTNTLIAVLTVATVYFTLIGLSLNAINYVDASLFFYVSLTVSILVSMVVLYGTLAGEREKKTLDLLLVAPVTASQIVAAKLVRVFVPVLGIVIGVTVPAAIFGIVRNFNKLEPVHLGGPFVLTLVGSILLTLAVSTFVSGLSMFMSSVNRTASGSLASTLAIIFVVYVVYWVLSESVRQVWPGVARGLMSVHPFSAMRDLIWQPMGEQRNWVSVPLSTVVHASLGVWFIALAAKKIDSERMRGGKSDA